MPRYKLELWLSNSITKSGRLSHKQSKKLDSNKKINTIETTFLGRLPAIEGTASAHAGYAYIIIYR